MGLREAETLSVTTRIKLDFGHRQPWTTQASQENLQRSKIHCLYRSLVVEIPLVIQALTSTKPSHQQETIDHYFTPEASFTHPFCRTGSNAYSKYFISRIYRWYKILSPRIALKVHSVSHDAANHILYVGMTQVFAIWALPFHTAEVSLVTVLHLERSQRTGKWLIASQNDLYQTDQFLKFLLPHFAWIAILWQYIATLVCVVCSYLLAPVTWWEEDVQRDFVGSRKPPNWNDAR